MRTLEYIPIGAVPESIEISPDGKLLAAVVMNLFMAVNHKPGRYAVL